MKHAYHLDEYFLERMQQLFDSLDTFQKKGDIESLHEVRVEVKKLKTMLLFLKETHPHTSIHRKRLKKLFSEAGMIRLFQLNIHWLHKNQFEALLHKSYKEEDLQTLIAELQLKIPKYQKDLRTDFLQWRILIKNTTHENIQAFCMLLLDELKIFAKNSNDKNTWHPFRKKIKQFLHSQNWIVPDKNQDFISTLDHLQEQLGSWHDLMAIQESLLSKQLYLSEDPILKRENAYAIKKIINTLILLERKIKVLLKEQQILLQSFT